MGLIDFLRDSMFQLSAYMQTGGAVMWPLAAVSLIMWLLIVERLAFIGRLYRRSMGFDEVRELLLAGSLPPGHRGGGAVGLLVEGFLAVRSGDSRLDRALLRETVRGLHRSLTDRLAVIGVLAAIAPLLGLLGTVTGMIATFDVLATFGTGNTRAMAGGISEALITTQTGLLVAIPGFYMKGFLERRARNLNKRIEAAGCMLSRLL